MWIFWLQIQFGILQGLKITPKVPKKIKNSYKELTNYSGYDEVSDNTGVSETCEDKIHVPQIMVWGFPHI